ncbi:MAG: HIT family protein [Candidatus Saccharibacteria bacterium]|nr:HIT family protein [Candidatus Saccharibacteria bacterium]
MNDSIFTKIIKGEIPCAKVYEDDKTFAFLDIHPIQPGHILVITKQQVENFEELDDETLAHLFRTVKKAALKIKSTFNPVKVGVRIEGFDVPHVHVHVYPCNTAEEFHGDMNRTQIEPDFKALDELAERLRF